LKSFFLPLLPFLFPIPLHAWGSLGHSTIAAIAEHQLSSSARSQITAILGQGRDPDLAAIANWADDVRAAAAGRGPLSDDSEARDFNDQFPTNALWHFVNLPLGIENYRLSSASHSPNNVVHAIQHCIAVLETVDNHRADFTKLQALRLLVHFVGDIHQPLHCGTGFYDLSDPSHPVLLTDPRLCDGKPNDRGGNDLWYGSEPNQELHALWDDALVYAISQSPDYELLARRLETTLVHSIGSTPGDYHSWPEQWAVDSAHVAQNAYRSLTLESASLEGQRLRISIRLAPDYLEVNQPIVAEQLAKGGVHLAQLLNLIKWH
jgi:nuclease S1